MWSDSFLFLCYQICDILYLPLITKPKNASPENWLKCTYDLIALSRRFTFSSQKVVTIVLRKNINNTFKFLIKGCGMGPWLVLVSPCFRENVVATYKIGSFLCSLDNLLQKNVIVFFFGIQISKWRSFEKRAIFDLLFTFFSHQGKLQKFLQHISHDIHTRFLLTLLTFLPHQFWKNTHLSCTVSPWYESWCWFLFAPF